MTDAPHATEAAPRCTVCAATLEPFDTGVVLRKYEVEFHRCPACGLIAAPDPTWLEEAYSSAIYDGDTGLLRRSRVLSTVTAALIRSEGLSRGRFLDWAGGYGALARMMRDKGFDFYTVDAYAKNLLAPGFDGDEHAAYDMVTAFEVMEHIADPVAELQEMLANKDRFFFTTQLQPPVPPRPGEWFYYALDSGQHITFHTVASLRIVAERLGFELTSNGDNYHLFHRGPIRPATRVLLSRKLAKASRGTVAAARRTVARGRSRGRTPA